MTKKIGIIAAAILGLAAATACSSGYGNGTPSTYVVTYRIVTTGSPVVDSVSYDNGTGTLVKVAAPSLTWQTSFSVSGGSSVEAHAWGVGAPASSIKLKATWTASGYSSAGDSSSQNTSAAVAVSLAIAHRLI